MRLFEKNNDTHTKMTIAAKIGWAKVQEIKTAVQKMNGGVRSGK